MSTASTTSKPSGTEATGKYSASEMKMMAIVMQNLDGGVPAAATIKLAACASELGLTESSMRVLWNKLRRKLMAEADTCNENDCPGAATGSTTTTPPTNNNITTPTATTTGKKRKGKSATDENGSEKTPTKKPRAKRTPAKPKAKGTPTAVAAAARGDDEEEEAEAGVIAKEDVREMIMGDEVKKTSPSTLDAKMLTPESANQDGDEEQIGEEA